MGYSGAVPGAGPAKGKTAVANDPISFPAAAVAGREIELKLHADPQHLARLAQHPGLLAMADGPPVVWRQTTTYYDTPDLRLAGRGVALRVRLDDDGRAVQTIKTLNCVAAGDTAAVAVRREWDWPLRDDNPDLSLLAVTGVDQLVPADALPELRPIFATEIRRTVLVVRPDAQTTIEVAFDVGVVRNGGRQHPISEIELELRSGKVGPLFDLALELQAIAPLRIAGESKAEAGYRLVTGRPAEPASSEPVALSPATTVAEAFRHIVRHCLRQLLQNEDCALMALAEPPAGDIAAVRYIRHALRRLRHGLVLFGPMIASPAAAGFADQCRTLGRRLRPARDWSIVGAVLRQAGIALPDDAPVPGAASDDAREAAARARAAIVAPEFTGLVLACGGWLEHERWCEEADDALRRQLTQPIADFAGPWLEELYRRLRKAGFERGDAEDLQRLRRRLRQLSYAAEGLRSLYPPAQVRPFMAALIELRTLVDDTDDLRRCRELLKEAGVRFDHAREAALERAWREGLGRLPEDWRRFRQVEIFWKRG